MARARIRRTNLSDEDSDSTDNDSTTFQSTYKNTKSAHSTLLELNAKSSNAKTTNNRSNRVISRYASSEDDDHSLTNTASSSRETSRVAASQYGLEDEKTDDDDDRDEWRLANRVPRDKQKNDPKYSAQCEKWAKFRTEFPIPMKANVSAGAILALRKQLKAKKKLVTSGIPVELRRDVWELLSGARAFPEKLEHANRFAYYLQHPPNSTITRQIQQDLSRALKAHLKFTTKTGQLELMHVLSAFAVRVPSIGYANSMAHVAAFLLLFYPEERAFWMLCTLIDIIMPTEYYTNSLLGARADAHLVKILVFQRLPKLHAHLDKMHQDVSMIALRWLMPMFLTTLSMHVCIRLFDILMLDGSNFLVQVALALFIIHNKKLLAITEEEDMIEYFDRIGADDISLDVDEIISIASSSKCAITEEELKRRETERRIMETAYMKDLQVTQKFRRLEDERRKKEEEAKRLAEEEEEKVLSYGTEMYKFGKQGKPRKTMVYLHNETPNEPDREKRIYVITWESKNKSPGECRMLLRDCSLFTGITHGVFPKRADVMKPFMDKAKQAISIVNPVRSLDVIALTSFDFESWTKVLMRIPMKSKPNTIKVNGVMTLAHDNDPSPSGESGGFKNASGAFVKRTPALQPAAGPAANKLAALLASAPQSSTSLSDEDEDDDPPPRARKR